MKPNISKQIVTLTKQLHSTVSWVKYDRIQDKIDNLKKQLSNEAKND